MPLYEFHCDQCGRDSELLVRSSHWAGTRCPHCASTRLEKKFSTFAASGATGGGDSGDACGMSGGGGCGACASGRPHQH